MKRRDFITLLGGAAAGCPLPVYLCEVSSSVRGAQCFMLHTERGGVTRGTVSSVPQPVGATY
jgi:hypothetical protein